WSESTCIPSSGAPLGAEAPGILARESLAERAGAARTPTSLQRALACSLREAVDRRRLPRSEQRHFLRPVDAPDHGDRAVRSRQPIRNPVCAGGILLNVDG